jgi:predicted nucleic acid-binding protein
VNGKLAVDTNAVIAYREAIPENDIWIAALCLVQNVPLLSNDGHFDKINRLEVINWQ